MSMSTNPANNILVDVRDIARDFDVSKPWLNRVMEGVPRGKGGKGSTGKAGFVPNASNRNTWRSRRVFHDMVSAERWQKSPVWQGGYVRPLPDAPHAG